MNATETKEFILDCARYYQRSAALYAQEARYYRHYEPYHELAIEYQDKSAWAHDNAVSWLLLCSKT